MHILIKIARTWNSLTCFCSITTTPAKMIAQGLHVRERDVEFERVMPIGLSCSVFDKVHSWGEFGVNFFKNSPQDTNILNKLIAKHTVKSDKMPLGKTTRYDKISSHNPEAAGSSPARATNIANRKRYRFGKPRNHNGFWVFLCHFSRCNSKDIISPK